MRIPELREHPKVEYAWFISMTGARNLHQLHVILKDKKKLSFYYNTSEQNTIKTALDKINTL